MTIGYWLEYVLGIHCMQNSICMRIIQHSNCYTHWKFLLFSVSGNYQSSSTCIYWQWTGKYSIFHCLHSSSQPYFTYWAGTGYYINWRQFWSTGSGLWCTGLWHNSGEWTENCYISSQQTGRSTKISCDNDTLHPCTGKHWVSLCIGHYHLLSQPQWSWSSACFH